MYTTTDRLLQEPSPLRQRWLSEQEAIAEVNFYFRRFEHAHAWLACHAALPVYLTPALVNLIRLNFLVREAVPWYAEADFLLSSLCRSLGGELYQVDPAVREVLLMLLAHQFGEQRPRQVARFLLAYLQSPPGKAQRAEIRRAQRWVAIAYCNPDRAISELQEYKEQILTGKSGLQLQFTQVVETIAHPLGNAQARQPYRELMGDARLLGAWQYGDKASVYQAVSADRRALEAGIPGALPVSAGMLKWVLAQPLPGREAAGEARPAEIEAQAPIPQAAPAPAPEAVGRPIAFLPQEFIERNAAPYAFIWQNPVLRNSLYPFRQEKLIDFLSWYAEIDLVREYKDRPAVDPQLTAALAQAASEMTAARQEIESQLAARIAARKTTDPFFNRITATDEKSLHFKVRYYLDRNIAHLEDKLDELQERQKTLLQRVDWFPNGAPQQQAWRDRADELGPQITAITYELAPVKEFRELFDRLAELPADATQAGEKEAALRWTLRARRSAWQALSHEQLIAALIAQVQAQPARYPAWLLYMLFHFSGMRYLSATGYLADPRSLLEILEKEQVESVVSSLAPAELAQACALAAQEIQRSSEPGMDTPVQPGPSGLLAHIKNPTTQQRALIEYRIEQVMTRIQALKDDDACLDRLVQLKTEMEGSGHPLPEWAWAEIIKYTPLGLNTQDPDWEILSKSPDLPAWSGRHQQTLELLAARAVATDIAGHIQRLRGHTPPAGLAARPGWYVRQAEKDRRAYLIQAPAGADFKTGASLFWLDWSANKPNPWQAARPLAGFSLYPGEDAAARPAQRGQARQKELARADEQSEGGWTYSLSRDYYTRTRRAATRQELKAQGKPGAEPQKIQSGGDLTVEYLRWRREAVVVELVEMIDGLYVLTFEGGKTGLNRHRLDDLRGNPLLFVGYVPEAPLPAGLEQVLAQALMYDRLLPGWKDKVAAPEQPAEAAQNEADIKKLQHALEYEDEHVRAEALIRLAGKLPPGLLGELLTAVQAISDVRTRAQALSELAPHLPPQLLGDLPDSHIFTEAPYEDLSLPGDIIENVLRPCLDRFQLTLVPKYAINDVILERSYKITLITNNQAYHCILRVPDTMLDRPKSEDLARLRELVNLLSQIFMDHLKLFIAYDYVPPSAIFEVWTSSIAEPHKLSISYLDCSHLREISEWEFESQLDYVAELISLEDLLPQYKFVPVPADHPQFYCARYPVTNAQYARFLNDPEYASPVYWRDFPKYSEPGRNGRSKLIGTWGDQGWQWLEPQLDQNGKLEPKFWHDPDFGLSQPDAPLVGVSWYEANAYCRWLFDKWKGLEEARANPRFAPRQIRLPLEAEWALAAGGERPEGRYPWDRGKNVTKQEKEIVQRANVAESGIGRTTSVWQHPGGASPHGVLDLAGNAWEWQANYRDKDHDVLSLRGGSWLDSLDYARVAARDLNHPVDRLYNIGFRVVAFPG